jgi:phage terminase small subunit
MKTPPETLKQKAWVKEYIECKNATEAAMRVYDCKDRDSAKAIGGENLSKLNFKEVLDARGLGDDSIAETLAEARQATRVISANVIVKSDDPKVKNKQATARDVDFIDVPDHRVRLDAAKEIAKLRDLYPSEKKDIKLEGEIVTALVEFVGDDDESTDKVS